MAILRVTAELLRDQLWMRGMDVEIVGASFDDVCGVVLLDVRGPDVPDAESVVAVVTMRPTGETVPEYARATTLEAR